MNFHQLRTSWCSLYCCLRWLKPATNSGVWRKKVLVGLCDGWVFGLALHTIYGSDSQAL